VTNFYPLQEDSNVRINRASRSVAYAARHNPLPATIKRLRDGACAIVFDIDLISAIVVVEEENVELPVNIRCSAIIEVPKGQALRLFV
jgi:hypothetical protein